MLKVIQRSRLTYRPALGSVKFCSVCGKLSRYTCKLCGARYHASTPSHSPTHTTHHSFCSIECDETHKETRCQKLVR